MTPEYNQLYIIVPCLSAYRILSFISLYRFVWAVMRGRIGFWWEIMREPTRSLVGAYAPAGVSLFGGCLNDSEGGYPFVENHVGYTSGGRLCVPAAGLVGNYA